MSHDRKLKWLNDRRIVYRRDPVTDIPDIETDLYKFYIDGTHQCYTLFSSKAKITTYKSLKWHFLVLYYLNIDCIEDDMRQVFKFIANKENGFATIYCSFHYIFVASHKLFNGAWYVTLDWFWISHWRFFIGLPHSKNKY